MRVPGTILGALALLFGFYQAPFAHIHPEDSDHPASASLLHWHLPQEFSDATPAVSAPTADDDAIDIGWNVVKCAFTQIACDFNIVEIAHLPILAANAAALPIPQRRGHDPPELAPKSPRAPPL